jgi:cytosine/adenosine deaminase-related metal-dependent hydrolase
MATLLVRHATLLATMDGQRHEIAGGAVFARDGVIQAVGPSDELPVEADEVLGAAGHRRAAPPAATPCTCSPAPAASTTRCTPPPKWACASMPRAAA